MKIQKIRLVSNRNSVSGTGPSSSETEQKLTISASGRLWFSAYCRSEEDDPDYGPVRKLGATLGKDRAAEVLDHIEEVFRGKIEGKRALAGSEEDDEYQLTITDTKGKNHIYYGIMSRKADRIMATLSDDLRSLIPVDGLFLFDGGYVESTSPNKVKYCYCSIQPRGMNTEYFYISDFGLLQAGDFVEVPFGKDNVMMKGVVIMSDIFEGDKVPFPADQTKHIIRQITQEEFEKTDESGDVMTPEDREDLEQIVEILEDENYDAMYQWAVEHHERDDSIQIMQKVVQCYEECVKQNMAAAALNLGTLYYEGRYVRQDYTKAYELYKIAADAGEPRAICNLGYCYYYGRHQEVDYDKAYDYFLKGALLFDDSNCLYKLGDMYLHGYHVEVNERYAYLLYERAMFASYSEDGRPDPTIADIMQRLGQCFLYGIGVSADVPKALTLLNNALTGFYYRRKEDPSAKKLIELTKKYIEDAERILDEEGDEL
ncbi:tetratricopeptide repeat protein [Butyrivibrio sp. MC2013]|uniref:tetratricopeptide repeat protein n=1 Tax=Butyrivibrio sp. MC2013 TaxID=1280686 RepID=UPI000414D6C7|nr:tetratricopeptide repeat protein [Butyrivibrio sp. MC2013]